MCRNSSPGQGQPPVGQLWKRRRRRHAHFIGTRLSQAAGVDLKGIPYRGNGPAIIDLIGGQLAAAILPAADLRNCAATRSCRYSACSRTSDRRWRPRCRPWRSRACRCRWARPGWACGRRSRPPGRRSSASRRRCAGSCPRPRCARRCRRASPCTQCSPPRPTWATPARGDRVVAPDHQGLGFHAGSVIPSRLFHAHAIRLPHAHRAW